MVWRGYQPFNHYKPVTGFARFSQEGPWEDSGNSVKLGRGGSVARGTSLSSMLGSGWRLALAAGKKGPWGCGKDQALLIGHLPAARCSHYPR